MTNEVTLHVRAKDHTRDTFKDAERRAKSSGRKVGLGFGIAAAAGAATGLGNLLGGFVTEAEEAGKVGRQTNAVIKSTGGVARVSAEDVDRLAGAIARKTGIDDEQIAAGQNMLLTFTNVQNRVGKGNDIFAQATKAAVDMSKATGTDLVTSNVQLGKALNDPIKGLTSLQRVGVTFSKGQKDQIAAMVKAGDVAGAQKIILAELRKEFGGSAAAQATWREKANVAWGDFQERIGNKVLPLLDKLFKFIVDKGIPALDKVGKFLGHVFAGRWEEAGAMLKEWGAKLLAWIRGDAAPAAKSALGKLGGELVAWIKPRIPGMIAALKQWGVRLASWVEERGLPMLYGALGKLGGQLIAWIIPRIPGMLVAINRFSLRLVAWIISRGIPMFANAMLRAGFALLDGLVQGITGRNPRVFARLEKLRDDIKAKFANATTWLRKAGADVIEGLLAGLKAPWDKVTAWVSGIAKWIKDHKGPISLDRQLLEPAGKALMEGLLSGLKFGFGPVGDFVYGAGSKISDVIDKIKKSRGPSGGGGIGAIGSGMSGARRAALRLGASSVFGHRETGSGRPAWDIMVPSKAVGNRIAAHLRANRGAYSLDGNIIWNMLITNAGRGWNWGRYTPIRRTGDYRHVRHVHASFDKGGWINEPVFGVGRSGKTYSFGEKESEYVTPGGKMTGGGRGSIIVNAVTNADPYRIAGEVAWVLKTGGY